METFYDQRDRAYFTQKKDFRAVIHRSPDRLDAVAMSCMVDPEAIDAKQREYEDLYGGPSLPTDPRDFADEMARRTHELGGQGFPGRIESSSLYDNPFDPRNQGGF